MDSSMKTIKISAQIDAIKTQLLFVTKCDKLKVLVFYNTWDTLYQELDTRFNFLNKIY